MQKDNVSRTFVTDENGKDLFYIDLVEDQELDFYFIKCSVNFDLFGNERIKQLICLATESKISQEQRTNLLNELIEQIKSIPGIDKFYFADELLDKNGKYMEYYSNALCNIADEMEFLSYTPFSRFSNAFFFGLIADGLLRKVLSECSIISKKDFETIINSSEQLQQEYLKVYDSNALYYFHEHNENEDIFDFRFMVLTNKIIFIVVKQRESLN